MSEPAIPLCECGCGEPAPVVASSHAARGYVKGQTRAFRLGHHMRIAPDFHEVGGSTVQNYVRRDRRLKIDLLRRVAEQGGCSICGTLEAAIWHRDHDHESGHQRSVLCMKCNVGLGHYNDDPDLLRKAAEYLEEWQSCTV